MESIYEFLKANLKLALEMSALFLGIVNGLMLLKFNLRDKPKLDVKPIHPEVYQWWFMLPSKEFEGQPTRRYGFLAYVGIVNRGLRKVSLESWRLFVKGEKIREVELKAINMPEIVIKIGSHIKMLPSLGQRTVNFEGDTVIDAGTSILGMVYYVYECWGDAVWNPKIQNGKITAKFVVKNAFWKQSKCKVVFSEKSLEWVTDIARGIEEIA
ncbi:MAG: hypothetical protein DMF68_16135 [Acidobacteria bacterium]|nr:MAG: hypothetical protein DMF68_16135 [Acidobacteriota bacterium]